MELIKLNNLTSAKLNKERFYSTRFVVLDFRLISTLPDFHTRHVISGWRTIRVTRRCKLIKASEYLQAYIFIRISWHENASPVKKNLAWRGGSREHVTVGEK